MGSVNEILQARPQQAASRRADRLWEYFGIWLMGGGLYCLAETVWRGWTHWTMFLAGGTLFLLIGLERGKKPWRWSLVSQAVVGGLTITAGEFLIGCVVNLWLGMRVWDYSDKPYNLLGQISLVSTVMWCGAALLVVLIYDLMHWLAFGGERPHYRFL